ncbi:MAG TPA: hypothetical protein VI818_00475, partial [Candidatus Thermoplasmatota archaeon]|nr:hypothetical protein [Candidatus Thermoplasmatota archaeon]
MQARPALLLVALFLVSAVVPSVDAVALPTLAVTEAAPVPFQGSQGPAPTRPVVAPFGVIPEDPSVPVVMDGYGPLPESPYARFVSRAAASRGLTPNLLAAFAADYFADLGFNTPGALGDFEENATLPYSYVLGDVDGDGYDDVALDTYCTEPDACRPFVAN